ncbi:MAG: response regulator transcription factor [Burkholderiaceae bacterium]
MSPTLSLNIVLVEDHDLLRTVTESVLKEAGHNILALGCAEEVDEALSGMNPDLYILDLNLPGEDGISLARRIRRSHPRVGIIMTTVRSEVTDRLDGYESGADIYLPKPTDPSELLAAAVALTRRLRPEYGVDSIPIPSKAAGTLQQSEDASEQSSLQDQSPVTSNDLGVAATSHAGPMLLLSSQAMSLTGARQQVLLTFAEVQLLSGLARAAGGVLERWQIASILDIDIDNITSASLEMRVARLRRKMTEASGHEAPIRSVRGVGYKLCLPLTVV